MKPFSSYSHSNLPDETSPGFSLLEVLIAFVIFALILTGLLRMTVTGDVVFSKGKNFASAAIIAGNEAERIRAIGAAGLSVKDTVYETTIENSIFEIRRTVLKSDHFPDQGLNTREISITITRKASKGQISEFRIVQGIER
jgi:prepilin-type N-terminal cleavage/methylation domain-containing protein